MVLNIAQSGRVKQLLCGFLCGIASSQWPHTDSKNKKTCALLRPAVGDPYMAPVLYLKTRTDLGGLEC